jgi:malate dehydrogenase (oxaloacetate-decarboxylating)(NADP+)
VITREEALAYHSNGRPGKIKISPTKPTVTQYDLSLAYTPGVAEPCLEIVKDPAKVFEYTARGNLVAVITNGSAVLGLGNIGAAAGNPEEIIRAVELMAPTFGGINLEDIRAPECFDIEKRLIESLDIPVFHDDQHGTAIISSAALLNALLITDRDLEDTKIVFSGAGAAAIGCVRLYIELGARCENITFVDSKGVIYKGRQEGMTDLKREFAVDTTARTLSDAMKNADVFIGVSLGGLVTAEMVKSMAERPIIFAMANPDPEIRPEIVEKVRHDAIMATGRSDYPNQVNNVLGFPFIFRGALDVRASTINTPMKLAAVHALAELARRGEAVPQVVRDAYPLDVFDFGENYIIPKPFDPRVLVYVASAVAQAAMESGVARQKVDLAEYGERLVQTGGVLEQL